MGRRAENDFHGLLRDNPGNWEWEGPALTNDGPWVFALAGSRRIGISTTELTKQLADYFGVTGGRGVLVTNVSDDGPAAKAGLRAAREGGAVALVDRSPLVQEVADKLAGEGAQTIALVANLEQFLGAATAIAAARNRFGRIDILINNVGGAINFKPYVEFTEAEIQAEIRRSLLPTMWCCRAVLPAMVERGRGVIVNVSSAAARGIHRIPYSAAKGGVNALTASLAWEYADHGIRVVATAPGGIEAPPRKVSRGTPEAQSGTARPAPPGPVTATGRPSLAT